MHKTKKLDNCELYSNDISLEGLQQELEECKTDKLRKMLDLLVHASQCRAGKCQYPNCRKVKGLFRHGIRCKVRASGGCPKCKKMWYLLQLHARSCKDTPCTVPRCRDLREHLRRVTQQADSRRRAAVMEMMRQRAAEFQPEFDELDSLKAMMDEQSKDFKKLLEIHSLIVKQHTLEKEELRKGYSQAMEDFRLETQRDGEKLIIETKIKMTKEAATEGFNISSWDVQVWETKLKELENEALTVEKAIGR